MSILDRLLSRVADPEYRRRVLRQNGLIVGVGIVFCGVIALGDENPVMAISGGLWCAALSAAGFSVWRLGRRS